MSPKYTFKKTRKFCRSFDKLTDREKQLCLEKFTVFRRNPWDRSLGTHVIHALSARANKKIYSVCLAGDLRAVFCVEEGDVIVSLDIGSHDIYR